MTQDFCQNSRVHHAEIEIGGKAKRLGRFLKQRRGQPPNPLFFPSLHQTNAGEQRQRAPRHTVGILERNRPRNLFLDWMRKTQDQMKYSCFSSPEKSLSDLRLHCIAATALLQYYFVPRARHLPRPRSRSNLILADGLGGRSTNSKFPLHISHITLTPKSKAQPQHAHKNTFLFPLISSLFFYLQLYDQYLHNHKGIKSPSFISNCCTTH
jgi:hypothetical protein